MHIRAGFENVINLIYQAIRKIHGEDPVLCNGTIVYRSAYIKRAVRIKTH
jgi:hypothetical protein